MLEAAELVIGAEAVTIDCRFVLGKPGAGYEQYLAGHIPGAHYLHLEDDLSGPVARHGGRHPLPDPGTLAEHFAAVPGVSPRIVYCGSGVTACVNLYALAQLGDNDALLYPGSWSDWCSYLASPD